MLTIFIEEQDTFDERTNEFETHDAVVLHLEHSLISLSKWESKFQRPFLSTETKTTDDVLGYIECMITDQDADVTVIKRCSQANFDEIQNYIDSTQSATTFGELPKHTGPREIITSELIYYWMTVFQIPFECQYWHLNRLFSLIRICNLKNQKPQEMSKTEMAQRYRDLNAKRKAELKTRG